MPSTPKKPRPAARPSRTLLPACAMVLIEQEQLRNSATAECKIALARLENARADWHRFERQDKPAFIRWRAREFGALLSEARDVEVAIRDHQALIDEVEREMRRAFQDAHTAYQRVLFRRERPEAASEEEAAERPADRDGARRLSEFEQEALFQEWVRASLGTNPDKMDDEVYSTTFETFKTHMFQPPREPGRGSNNHRSRGPLPSMQHPETDEPPAALDARVKELYRILVRRLHPDARADGVAAASSLWHEVQEAYTAADVARMEILLALSNIESDDLREQTSLAQMRSVLAELHRALRALEKSVQEAQGEDAWDFARTGPAPNLRANVQRELKSDLAARKLRLQALSATIAAWARSRLQTG